MTRWNASTSSFALLHLLLTLSSPTSAAAFGFRARHHGKSHKNNHHRAIEPRQDIPNAPFVRIDIISIPAPTPPAPVGEQFDTISAIDAAGFGGVAAPSTTSMNAVSSGNDQAAITSYAPPLFPVTVIHVPIYTICPDAPGYLNTTSSQASNVTGLYSNATITGIRTDSLSNLVSTIAISINATALLSNGSSTTFLSQSLATPASAIITPTPATDARIVLGTNGCQTLYSASTTQICSTIINRGGQVPISVSDCSQLVTFSSSVATAAPMPVCNCPNTSLSLTSFPTSSSTSSAITSGAGTSTGLAVAFYAAPWHEIAAGLVPGLVHVANCPDESGDNCSTSSESWSLSTRTSSVTRTGTVQYAGPAVFAQGATTVTTSVSYSSLRTWTHTLLIPTIVRAAVTTAAATRPAERTVTVQVTIPQVQTWELERVRKTTQVTEVVTVTVTVPGTVRVTHTATMGGGGV